GSLNRRAVRTSFGMIDISVTILIHALQVAGDLLLARDVAADFVMLMGTWMTRNGFYIAAVSCVFCMMLAKNGFTTSTRRQHSIDNRKNGNAAEY
ncbi:MAG: hypothetical protein J1E60_02720, partial [Christensenellaceae bacterium]|nr:hypothetical protein [Christensenellaceae bacterium]